MPTVGLIATHAKLGYSPAAGTQVKLSDLRTAGYTRVYSSSNWWRVNPMEVYNGTADDPERADNKHYLGNWYGYVHNDIVVGTGVTVTGGYGEATVGFTTPAAYAEKPELLAVKCYVKGTGYSGDSPGETETSVEPRTSPWTTDIEGYTASEPTEITINAPSGEWVGFTITGLFDDSNAVHESTSEYSADAGETYPLTGGDLGVLAKIWDSTPSFSSANQTTDPTSCFSGEDVTISLNWNMEGPSTGTLQRKKSGGSWTTIDSNVTAGSSGGTDTVQSGFTYYWRLRYNDVSPNQWSSTVSESAECTQL